MKINTKKFKISYDHPVFNYVLIVLLAMTLALAYNLFVVPNNFAPAGVNGIAAMVEKVSGVSLGNIFLIVNIPLCLFAFFFVDREFACKTFAFSLIFSLTYNFLRDWHELDNLRYYANDVDTLFPALLAGGIGGIVNGISFRIHSSTGGTDIIAKYLSKKRPELNFFWIIFGLNCIVALASFFVYAIPDPESGELLYQYKPVCLCVLYCFVSSVVANRILAGSKEACKFTIVTTHAAEIDAEIRDTLQHSATQICGTGIYSGEEKEVIICVVNKHQMIDFSRILQKYDNTFAFVEIIHDTFGNFRRSK